METQIPVLHVIGWSVMAINYIIHVQVVNMIIRKVIIAIIYVFMIVIINVVIVKLRVQYVKMIE